MNLAAVTEAITAPACEAGAEHRCRPASATELVERHADEDHVERAEHDLADREEADRASDARRGDGVSQTGRRVTCHVTETQR